MSLEGKTAIVSGASSGIGAAVVRQLRAAGVRVAGGARRVERVEADVALELDVTDAASCERFVEAAVAELGGLDLLFNNAGLAPGRTRSTNGTRRTRRSCSRQRDRPAADDEGRRLPGLEASGNGGHIVNVGSIAGFERPIRAAPGTPRRSTLCAPSTFGRFVSRGC